MTIPETELHTPSFEELRQENIRLRRKLKQILLRMRLANVSRDHIIELRSLLRIAPEILAQGVHLGTCPNWDQEELHRKGLTGEEFLLKHEQTKRIFYLAYAQANGAKLVGKWNYLDEDDQTKQIFYLAYAQANGAKLVGGWNYLDYLLVPHFSQLFRYYRQMRQGMQNAPK
jgi:hypothetical protein